ncbi:MAG TPA: thioredoxin domain-containing protein [Anaeromyxobacteraceae bacterium]|nr:thioredoxin domain-containing protein [Anaeromyxobacteraceae bacterium]
MRNNPAVLGALALFAAACQSPRPAQQASDPGKLDPKMVVAKVGGTPITAAELEDKVRPEQRKLEAQYQERLHELRKNALEAMIRERLVEAKAKAHNLTATEYVNREVVQKLTPPSDAEVRALYERAKASGQQLPPFEQVRDDIGRFLNQQKGQMALQEFHDGLRREAGVEVLLPPYQAPKVEVAAVGPSKGPASAPVTIVEFSDFQCPFCARVEPTVAELLEKYPGKIRLVYRDYPLPNHGDAPKAAEAAHCAGDQGKYWEMHGHLFANQSALKVEDLKAHARQIGLDGAKFDRCLDSGAKASLVAENLKAGNEAGVSGTPAFFINGRLLSGARPLSDFEQAVNAELGARN